MNQNQNTHTPSPSSDSWVMFFILLVSMLVVVVGAFALDKRSRSPEGIQEGRDFQLKQLGQLHPGFKAPPVSLVGSRDELDRKVVFLKPCPGCKEMPAIIYAAQLEKEFGRQEWLEPVFNTYVMTENEYNQARKLQDEKILERPSKL
jgi:hypothetical protein